MDRHPFVIDYKPKVDRPPRIPFPSFLSSVARPRARTYAFQDGEIIKARYIHIHIYYIRSGN